jgi:hypothetical protein
MLDDVAIAISTGAAGNMVAYMFSGQIDALRDQVAKMFRHGTEQERSRALRALEEHAVGVGQQAVSGADLTRQWSNTLLSYLNTHPEARADIESFASSPVVTRSTIIGSLNHYGSGPQIAGNYHGNITFNNQE